jgi:hypothetical protein
VNFKLGNKEKLKAYPYEDGEFLIIGPECFTRIGDASTIAYKGKVYVASDDIVKPKDRRTGLLNLIHNSPFGAFVRNTDGKVRYDPEANL